MGQQTLNGSTPQRSTALAAQAEASGSTLAGQQSQIVTQNVAAAGEKVEVKLSAPEIDWSYAVVERLDSGTLKTSLPFLRSRQAGDRPRRESRFTASAG